MIAASADCVPAMVERRCSALWQPESRSASAGNFPRGLREGVWILPSQHFAAEGGDDDDTKHTKQPHTKADGEATTRMDWRGEDTRAQLKRNTSDSNRARMGGNSCPWANDNHSCSAPYSQSVRSRFCRIARV